MDELDEIIERKRKVARKHCKDSSQLYILSTQIAVCEELGKGLAEKVIIDLATMPLRRMEVKIYNHKFL